MDLCYRFDSERYFLGNLCKYGHAFPGTNQSLRIPQKFGKYQSSLCVACQKGSFRGQPWHFRFVDLVASGFPAGSRLGKLCPAGHEFMQLGLTLRDKRGSCPECDRERQRAGSMNAEALACRRLSQRQYMRNMKEDPAFALSERLRTKARKVRQKGNHSLPVAASHVKDRFSEFTGCCAYCGRRCTLQIEHMLPRAHGGPHVLGNLLPACAQCNSSKRDKDPEAWYRAQPFFSEKRWRKILRVLGKGKGSPLQLPLL